MEFRNDSARKPPDLRLDPIYYDPYVITPIIVIALIILLILFLVCYIARRKRRRFNMLRNTLMVLYEVDSNEQEWEPLNSASERSSYTENTQV